MNEIFAKRFAIARQRSGLSMQELADKADISKQSVNKYEKGEMMPSSEILLKLKDVFDVDLDFFSRNSLACDIKLVQVEHREKEKLAPQEIEKLKGEAIEFLERYFELEKIANEKSKFSNPVADMEIKDKKDAEKAAKLVRKRWRLGNGPIKNVIGMLEAQGIKVYRAEYPETFNGFSAWAGTIPIIVVNFGIKEITRVRFTALHELGHLILQVPDEVDGKILEKICDAFASELLLPTEMLILELGAFRSAISMQELKAIKEKFGISVLAIMVRTHIARIITSQTYNVWKMNYDKDVINETGDFGEYSGDELSRRFDQLLFKCLVEEKISINKAASLSGKSVSTLYREHKLNNAIYNYLQ